MLMYSLRWGGLFTAIGALLWISSEVIEVGGGGLSLASNTTLLLGAIAAALGIWAIAVYQSPGGGWLNAVGIVVLSIALVLESVVEALTLDATSLEEVAARAGLLVPVMGTLLVIGGVCLGIAVLRARVYPFWTGIALMGALPLLLIAFVADLPVVITSIANITSCMPRLGVLAQTHVRPERVGSNPENDAAGHLKVLHGACDGLVPWVKLGRREIRY